MERLAAGLFCLVAALALGAFGDTTTLVYSTVPAREGRPAVELKLDLHRPAAEGTHPCFVYFHGGSWRTGSRGRGKSFAGQLGKLGWTVASVDYRLVDGGRNPFPAQIEDCKAAIRYLRQNAAELGIDPARICVAGESAGGHLASLAGVTSGWDVFGKEKPVADPDSAVLAVVDMFGPTDLMAIAEPAIAAVRANPNTVTPQIKNGFELLGTRDLDTALKRLEESSPTAYLSGKLPAEKMPRFLILHSSGDPVVPVSQSQRFHAALTKAGVKSEIKVYESKGHGLPGPSKADMIRFLTSVAGK